jgi:hypothetical protein
VLVALRDRLGVVVGLAVAARRGRRRAERLHRINRERIVRHRRGLRAPRHVATSGRLPRRHRDGARRPADRRRSALETGSHVVVVRFWLLSGAASMRRIHVDALHVTVIRTAQD